MSNDTILSVIMLCLLVMTFITGALMGSLRRDNEWRIHLAKQGFAEDKHWDTAVREPKQEKVPSIWADKAVDTSDDYDPDNW